MKRVLLGTTALIGASLAAPAAAESPIKLSVGGFFRTAYMVVLDDDDSLQDSAFPEPGDDKAEDGVFSDAEIHFVGRTVLDNGLEVGARVELEGEDDDDQIDEAWIWFAGGFGEVRIGSDDEALANSCVLPPGGTANFSAFSPNQWGANSLNSIPFGTVSNSACTGVDDRNDAQKILYFSPLIHGFQLSASYTPNPDVETHDDGGGAHVGMPAKIVFPTDTPDADADASVYLTYSYQGRDWGLTWGGGASWEMGTDDSPFADFQDQDFYQTGLTVDIGRFSIGGAFEYYHDLNSSHSLAGVPGTDLNAWVAGGGLAYSYRAWTFGAQYSYRQDTFRQDTAFTDFKVEQVQQRAVATVNYALGPGINLDGEVGYTWRDFDPENEFFGSTTGDDDYDGVELGIGTALSF